MRINDIRAPFLLAALLTVALRPASADEICRNIGAGETPTCSRLDATGNCDLNGGKFALVFGNNTYGEPLKTLVNAHNDARSMAEVLHTAYGFSVRCILDADALQADTAIEFAREVAKKFDAPAPKRNRLVVYFSGHGFQNPGEDTVNVVFRNPLGTPILDAAKSVGTIVQNIQEKIRSVSPFVVVDACRSKGPAGGTFASAATITPAALTIGPMISAQEIAHFVGYAVPATRTASDEEDRFTPFLVDALQERGQSFFMIWDQARRKYNTHHNNSIMKKGPQHQGNAAAAYHQRFQTAADDCDDYFFGIWQIVARSQFDFNAESPGTPACRMWQLTKNENPHLGLVPDVPCANMSCGAALRCKFQAFFKTCDRLAGEVERLDGTDIAFGENLEDRRLTEAIYRDRPINWAYDIDLPDGASPAFPEDGFRFKLERAVPGEAWREEVIAKTDVGLRRLPIADEKVHTPVPAGTHFEVDCKTLLCDTEWIGVRYKPPGLKETWRAFVPRSEVEPVAAKETIVVKFDEFGYVPTSDVLDRIDGLVKKHAGRSNLRVRIFSHYARNKADYTKEKDSERQALIRLSVLDGLLRKKGLYGPPPSSVPKFEIIRSESAQTADAFIEIQ